MKKIIYVSTLSGLRRDDIASVGKTKTDIIRRENKYTRNIFTQTFSRILAAVRDSHETIPKAEIE